MLETRIEQLTAAVIALTAAIGDLKLETRQVAVQALDVTLQAKEIAREVENTPKGKPQGAARKTTSSKPIESTSPASSSESPVVTYDDVKRATNAVSKISRDKAVAGLARFGVTSATKLAEAQWADYVAYMARVAAGELDPEDGE